MRPFDLVRPASLKEALDLLDLEDPTIRPMAGGTALMLMMKSGLFEPSRLVSLAGVESRYREVAAVEGGLRIGALASLAQLELSTTIAEAAPVISRTMRTLSNRRVRNVATVGGALAHGDPHMDLPPVLIALGATLTVAGPEGDREVAAEDLIEGYFETVLNPNELISEVFVPRAASRGAAYLKCTTRSADDWPALGVAVSVEAEGETVRDIRICASAATEKPIRLTGAETILSGATLDETVLKKAGDAAADEAETTSDAQGSAAYKKQLMRVYVGRAVRAAMATRRGAGA